MTYEEVSYCFSSISE